MRRRRNSLLAALADRLGSVGLERHPVKTRVMYCKDATRRKEAENTSFDFLGLHLPGRVVFGQRGFSVSFTSAMSDKAMKAKGKQIRDWHLNRRSGTDLSGLAEEINPQVRGWINDYGTGRHGGDRPPPPPTLTWSTASTATALAVDAPGVVVIGASMRCVGVAAGVRQG